MSTPLTRRAFLRTAGMIGAAAAFPTLLGACAGQAPAVVSGSPIKIGFIPLTDCASVVMAKELGLVLNKAFSQKKDEVKAVMKAVLEASIWLDDQKNRKEAARVIGRQAYVNAPAEVIEARLHGQYNLGCNLGEHTYQDDYMLFHGGGAVNFPRRSHGIYFMTQYVRFHYLSALPDLRQAVDTLILQDLYREVAGEMKLPVPDDDMKPFTVAADGFPFDPSNPAAALQQYGGGRA